MEAEARRRRCGGGAAARTRRHGRGGTDAEARRRRHGDGRGGTEAGRATTPMESLRHGDGETITLDGRWVNAWLGRDRVLGNWRRVGLFCSLMSPAPIRDSSAAPQSPAPAAVILRPAPARPAPARTGSRGKLPALAAVSALLVAVAVSGCAT